MKTIQRSPDLGIGIKLQPLVPVVKPIGTPVVPPTPQGPFIAAVSFQSASIYGPSLVHTVSLSRVFDSPKAYTFQVIDDTAHAGVDFIGVLTSLNFGNGVTYAAGTISVPAGVTSFTVTIFTIFNPNGSFVNYRLAVVDGSVEVSALGLGTIYDI